MTTVGAIPAAVDLAVYQGDDFGPLTLTVTNPDGSAANLTGATFNAQIRSAPGAATVLASFTTSVATNVITLTMAATDTLTLPAGAAWDCQMTTSAGKIQTLAAGQVKTTADVSR